MGGGAGGQGGGEGACADDEARRRGGTGPCGGGAECCSGVGVCDGTVGGDEGAVWESVCWPAPHQYVAGVVRLLGEVRGVLAQHKYPYRWRLDSAPPPL